MGCTEVIQNITGGESLLANSNAQGTFSSGENPKLSRTCSLQASVLLAGGWQRWRLMWSPRGCSRMFTKTLTTSGPWHRVHFSFTFSLFIKPSQWDVLVRKTREPLAPSAPGAPLPGPRGSAAGGPTPTRGRAQTHHAASLSFSP